MIWDFSDYRIYLREVLDQDRARKKGSQARLARHLNVSSVIVSQVLSGSRNLSLEQAFDAADYLGLTKDEKRYFLAMVQMERAGTERLKLEFAAQLDVLKQAAAEINRHVPIRKKLKLSEQGEFYSDRMYSVLRLATSITELQTSAALQARFQLSKVDVNHILNFLTKTGLCVSKYDRVVLGPTSTHLEKKSPWVKLRHHQWRQVAVESISKSSTLSYTAPVSISKRDAKLFRSELLEVIRRFAVKVEASSPEALWCLNLDWFEI